MDKTKESRKEYTGDWRELLVDAIKLYEALRNSVTYGMQTTASTEAIMNAIAGKKCEWSFEECRAFLKNLLNTKTYGKDNDIIMAGAGFAEGYGDITKIRGRYIRYYERHKLEFKELEEKVKKKNKGEKDLYDKIAERQRKKEKAILKRIAGEIVENPEKDSFGISEEGIFIFPPENNETNVHFPVFSVKKDLAEYFVSREDILEKLKEGFSDKANRKTMILSGMGGVGKTQIALKYAHETRDDYDLIRWIDATNEETLINSVEEFLKRYDTAPNGGADDLSAAVRLNRFVNRLSDKHILLIYDNADYLDEDQEKKKLLRKTLLNYMPDGDCHILITTRCNVSFNEAKPIRVDVFEPKAALEYLVKKAGRPACPEAEILAERMGYLPLALCYAGAYIEVQENMAYADYLKRWDDYGLIVFDQEDFAEKTVRRALTITLDKLDPERRSFWYALLRQASHMGGEYFAPKVYAELVCKTSNNSILVDEPITATFRALKNFVTNALDPLKLEQAMNILRKYSLADWDGTRMTVHPMLKETIWAENHGNASVLNMEMHRSNMHYHLMNMYRQAGDKLLERKYGQLIVLERLDTLEIVLKEAQEKAKENGTKPDYQLMKELLELKEFGGFILEYGNAEDKERLATIEKIVTEEEAN